MMTGLFRTRDSAERAYDAAIRCGYTKDDVGVLMSEEARNPSFPA
jgi:hypothetical protein